MNGAEVDPKVIAWLAIVRGRLFRAEEFEGPEQLQAAEGSRLTVGDQAVVLVRWKARFARGELWQFIRATDLPSFVAAEENDGFYFNLVARRLHRGRWR